MADQSSSQFIKRLPLIVGAIGGTVLFLNRLTTPDLTNAQSRSDAVGIILSALLILVSLLWEQIQPLPPDQVVLSGKEVFVLTPDLPEPIQKELAWASRLILTNTVTKSLLVHYQHQTLLRRGIFPEDDRLFQPGAIVTKVLQDQKPIYLVDLKLYPGRVEFNYLPEEIQGLICHPLGKEGVLIMAANAPRSYTKQDEAWLAAIADKLTDTLTAS
ncbi:MAG: cofactor assembly of complex C subunit B [Synechococcaceae cyanobacterium RL_1_2]|nr:cofactor assembly of complex C subunit B [Synechococcaceae cyanobacterium RL_1_2]